MRRRRQGGERRRGGCCGGGGSAGQRQRQRHIVKTRLRVITGPQAYPTLGDLRVVDVEDHLVVVVESNVTALGPDLKLVPGVLVSRHHLLLEIFKLASTHARKCEIVTGAARRQHVKVLRVHIPENQSARAVEPPARRLERRFQREVVVFGLVG